MAFPTRRPYDLGDVHNRFVEHVLAPPLLNADATHDPFARADQVMQRE